MLAQLLRVTNAGTYGICMLQHVSGEHTVTLVAYKVWLACG